MVAAVFIIVAFIGAVFYGIEYRSGLPTHINRQCSGRQIHLRSRRRSQYRWISVGSFWAISTLVDEREALP